MLHRGYCVHLDALDPVLAGDLDNVGVLLPQVGSTMQSPLHSLNTVKHNVRSHDQLLDIAVCDRIQCTCN